MKFEQTFRETLDKFFLYNSDLVKTIKIIVAVLNFHLIKMERQTTALITFHLNYPEKVYQVTQDFAQIIAFIT